MTIPPVFSPVQNGQVKLINECREARGWSMQELGNRIGCTATHVNKLEKGQRPVTPEMALRLGEVFERDPREFGFDPYRYLSSRERALLATVGQLSETDQEKIILTARAWLPSPPWDGMERRKRPA